MKEHKTFEDFQDGAADEYINGPDRRKKGNWIHVWDKYPEDGVMVLLAFDNNVVAIGYRMSKTNGKKWMVYGDIIDIKSDSLTYWMPLPKHPLI